MKLFDSYKDLRIWASLVAQTVKDLAPMQETQVQSLGREDSLQKGTETHSNILAWESHGQRSLVGYSLWDHKEMDITERSTLIRISD